METSCFQPEDLMLSSEYAILAPATPLSCWAPNLPSGPHRDQFLNPTPHFTSPASKPVPLTLFTIIRLDVPSQKPGSSPFSLGYYESPLPNLHPATQLPVRAPCSADLLSKACQGFPSQRPGWKCPWTCHPQGPALLSRTA